MASSIEFVEFVCNQMDVIFEVHYKKMFGEYGIYCDNKVIGTVCNNTFYLKVVPETEGILKDVPLGIPYESAKPCYMVDFLDDKKLLKEVIEVTTMSLPAPKPKKQKMK